MEYTPPKNYINCRGLSPVMKIVNLDVILPLFHLLHSIPTHLDVLFLENFQKLYKYDLLHSNQHNHHRALE